MKSAIRTIEPQNGFYEGDGLEDMYRPEAYSAYGEANAMNETSARYGANCKVIKRTFRRYAHS